MSRLSPEEAAWRETPEGVAFLAERKRKYAAKFRENNREKCKAASKNWVDRNKDRVAKRRSAWKEANKDRVYRANRALELREYGITLEQYEAMNDTQCGLCLICGESQPGKSLFVDHCHDTGRVRGLLCAYCNFMIGHAKDDPMRLLAGAAYLRKS